MTDDDIKTALKRYLPRGKDHAIKKRDLMLACNCNDREMRLAIIDLIEEGCPVCSSTGNPAGYYIATDTQEIEAAMQTIGNYAVSAFIHRRALRKCLRSMEAPLPVLDNGQIKLL